MPRRGGTMSPTVSSAYFRRSVSEDCHAAVVSYRTSDLSPTETIGTLNLIATQSQTGA
jgi:hypothetical protein